MVVAQETPKEVWPLSPWARKVAQEAMDRRAAWEKREIEAYRKDLKTVHGQAVRDFEYFSHLIHGALQFLHHSEDLDVTLQEARRVLHPRGALIAVDRGWPDFYTDDQLNAMLDQELNENLKRKYGIPLDQPFTRRDFGEHEYRYRDWEAFFQRNGFELHLFRFWHPPALNRIWLRLPTFDWTVRWSAWRARRGARRHVLYGWGKKRILLVAIPQKGA